MSFYRLLALEPNHELLLLLLFMLQHAVLNPTESINETILRESTQNPKKAYV